MPTKREDDANYWKTRKAQRPSPAAQLVPIGNTRKSGIHPTAEVLPGEDCTAHDALIAGYYVHEQCFHTNKEFPLRPAFCR